MESLNFIRNNASPIDQNDALPKELRSSKSVYICKSSLKICFIITILILLLIREILFTISEKHLNTLLNYMLLNKTSSSIN